MHEVKSYCVADNRSAWHSAYRIDFGTEDKCDIRLDGNTKHLVLDLYLTTLLSARQHHLSVCHIYTWFQNWFYMQSCYMKLLGTFTADEISWFYNQFQMWSQKFMGAQEHGNLLKWEIIWNSVCLAGLDIKSDCEI